MSDLKYFLKSNKKQKVNMFYPATKSLCDEDGNPVMWEIRALSTKESEDIREACTFDVQVPGKKGQFRAKLDTKMYLAKLAASAVVVPNLFDAKLQDSYGVKTPEDLIRAMLDNSTEYAEFISVVQEFNGIESLQDKCDEAKN